MGVISLPVVNISDERGIETNLCMMQFEAGSLEFSLIGWRLLLAIERKLELEL